MVNSTLEVVHDQGDFGILKKRSGVDFFASNLKEESELRSYYLLILALLICLQEAMHNFVESTPRFLIENFFCQTPQVCFPLAVDNKPKLDYLIICTNHTNDIYSHIEVILTTREAVLSGSCHLSDFS